MRTGTAEWRPIPGLAGYTVTVGNAGTQGNVVLSDNDTLGQLTFSGGTGVTIAPTDATHGSLTFDNGGSSGTAALSVNHVITHVDTISAPVSLNSPLAISVVDPTDLLVISGSLNNNGNAMWLTGSGGVTLSGNLSGAGALNPSSSWSGTLTFSGPNNSGFSGGINVSTTAVGGTIAVTNSSSLGTGTLEFGNVNNYASRQFLNVGTGTTPYTIPNTLLINGYVEIGGGNPVTLTGNFVCPPTATTDTHIFITNSATTTLAGDWIASVANPGGLLSINGSNASGGVNIVLSGYDATYNGGTRFGYDYALNGSLTFAGTMDKQLYYLFGSPGTTFFDNFTVNIDSDTAFVADPNAPTTGSPATNANRPRCSIPIPA